MLKLYAKHQERSYDMNIINVSEIIIPTEFEKSQPKEEKLERVRAYVDTHGKLDKPVVLDNNILSDNYIRYLIAIEKGFTEIPYITTQEYQESNLKSRQLVSYVTGKFHNSAKEYTWKNIKAIPIKIGDKILVKSRPKHGKGNVGVVRVTNIFVSDNKQLLRHKPVIKNLSAMKGK